MRTTKTLLQKMTEIEGEKNKLKWFESLTPKQRQEVLRQAIEATDTILSFMKETFLPVIVKLSERNAILIIQEEK